VSSPPLRICVVIPTRDEEDRLPRCLASVAAQTRSADEVNVRIVGPYLFVLDAREGPNPVAKMSRFA